MRTEPDYYARAVAYLALALASVSLSPLLSYLCMLTAAAWGVVGLIRWVRTWG